jgi:minimal PKS acyl carrier protein
MSATLTPDDLLRILRECAGDDGTLDIAQDVLDRTFTDLGYDSVAVLETAGRVSREYGVAIDDDVVAEAATPRALLSIVNAA